MQTDLTPQCSIKLLPDHLINQIKAGEVIERPASLIKELLENSIDAKSTRIDVTIKEQGLNFISIEDDGKGMSFDELPLAFTKHATSKLNFFEDLYNLTSYGFRGEALSSMASVARLECLSSPRLPRLHGGKYIIHGGKMISHTPFNAETSGTSIFIKDLFYNTPARLKFIKARTSEQNAICRIINAFIISNPSIAFSLKQDEQDKIIYPSTEKTQYTNRITQIFNNKKTNSGKLLHASTSYQAIHINGYFSHQTNKSNAYKHQFLFVNHRLFMDKKINQIILKSLAGFWPALHTGHYALFINLPPDQIDINVHPAKTSVKFFNENLICSLIMEAIKTAVNDLKLKIDIPTPPDNLTKLSVTSYLPSPSDQAPQTHRDSSTSSFFPLSHKYILLKKECNYLIAFERLLKEFLKINFKQTYPVHENKLIPLLISEPFHLPSERVKSFLPELLKTGINLDILDANLLVLRTIPDFCLELPLDLLFKNLLDYLAQRINDFPEGNGLALVNQWLTDSSFDYALSINSTKLQEMLSQFQITDLVSSGMVTVIDDEKLAHFFTRD
ncbi:MAG: hypothetical protein A2381_07595 [Bdellovibrionales bacterium RIFOXYB1_FULL_37_110]|nr:MAG: hypothetical protein A2181_04360 [Bdellovibrionales bacterium RIFOXYA1_FULL_38_20]OFZ52470.1 MAG: hypothetical protein A2417_00315 [Bdellovibrionales bacterium RIFOXYC1_FULL_37_79]OFZ59672.1 MAG: hypothetical protein A2381_07595 [Bdellovibrionales bacterium RIFOXYB1_FULL_37_110]OFZ62599.1 MAG: hypothetical protein A2577_11915 [Bdellovibrionales bacterium RIFOXYD1_FULL_36_51]